MRAALVYRESNYCTSDTNFSSMPRCSYKACTDAHRACSTLQLFQLCPSLLVPIGPFLITEFVLSIVYEDLLSPRDVSEGPDAAAELSEPGTEHAAEGRFYSLSGKLVICLYITSYQ